MSASEFLSKADQSRIVQSIEAAETDTSGEIRVHIETYCKEENPLDRAVYIFNKLKMNETALRNGVLIYIAFKSRKLAIIGDSGINKVVPINFWDEVYALILQHIKTGDPASGICAGIELAGSKLKEFFPYTSNDINEQSDEISFGE